jgi:hypothetical protein
MSIMSLSINKIITVNYIRSMMVKILQYKIRNSVRDSKFVYNILTICIKFLILKTFKPRHFYSSVCSKPGK